MPRYSHLSCFLFWLQTGRNCYRMHAYLHNTQTGQSKVSFVKTAPWWPVNWVTAQYKMTTRSMRCQTTPPEQGDVWRSWSTEGVCITCEGDRCPPLEVNNKREPMPLVTTSGVATVHPYRPSMHTVTNQITAVEMYWWTPTFILCVTC